MQLVNATGILLLHDWYLVCFVFFKGGKMTDKKDMKRGVKT